MKAHGSELESICDISKLVSRLSTNPNNFYSVEVDILDDSFTFTKKGSYLFVSGSHAWTVSDKKRTASILTEYFSQENSYVQSKNDPQVADNKFLASFESADLAFSGVYEFPLISDQTKKVTMYSGDGLLMANHHTPLLGEPRNLRPSVYARGSLMDEISGYTSDSVVIHPNTDLFRVNNDSSIISSLSSIRMGNMSKAFYVEMFAYATLEEINAVCGRGSVLNGMLQEIRAFPSDKGPAFAALHSAADMYEDMYSELDA
jgi:hypothetical protein